MSGGTSAPSSASVSITSSGFSPATLTVGVGGTVTWTNSDSARHQPATDPHPTHTGLAGFDAIGGLSQGETFQFTFTRAGTFPYHDHTFPLRQGTVIVQ
ncbi:MAG: amidase [Candidatus Kerfeldbacteria bacterium]|nr:amidase [Candidatus Kerfeldbacteria bacterium]